MPVDIYFDIVLTYDTDGVVLNLNHRQLRKNIESSAEVSKICAWNN